MSDLTPDSAPAAPLGALGPQPFVFHPSSQTIEGPAFSRAFQGITWATLLGSGYWLLTLWQQGKFGGDTGLEGLRAAGWFVLGWGLLAWTTWHVMFSRARLDATGIHQTWIWDKAHSYSRPRVVDGAPLLCAHLDGQVCGVLHQQRRCASGV